MTDKPHNADMSTTWPQPPDEYKPDTEEDERKREAIRRFLERQQERRRLWRKRRGWETP